MKKIMFMLVLFILFFTDSECIEAENLIKDPSFEDLIDFQNGSSTWRTLTFNAEKGYSEFAIETSGAHTGEKYVTITNHKENHSRFVQRVNVESGKIYRLSCWAKTENVGIEAKGAIITEEGIIEHSPGITGTTVDWVYTEMYIRIGKNIDSIVVSVSLGGYYGTNKGKASFDDVTVQEVIDMPQGAVVATKGDFIEKDIPTQDEEKPIRIVKEPMSMNIPVIIALVLALIGIAYIIGRIVYINVIKKKK